VPREEKFTFRILIKWEPDAWVARCLELGLVTVAETMEQAESDLMDVIMAHVSYAIENDNMEHMYHPAPPEVWKEFFACEDREETCHRQRQAPPDESRDPVPVIQASKCFYRQPSSH